METHMWSGENSRVLSLVTKPVVVAGPMPFLANYDETLEQKLARRRPDTVGEGCDWLKEAIYPDPRRGYFEHTAWIIRTGMSLDPDELGIWADRNSFALARPKDLLDFVETHAGRTLSSHLPVFAAGQECYVPHIAPGTAPRRNGMRHVAELLECNGARCIWLSQAARFREDMNLLVLESVPVHRMAA